MDIIEGLDLSDAAADGLGFSLDDILEEFKTTIPAKPAPEPPPAAHPPARPLELDATEYDDLDDDVIVAGQVSSAPPVREPEETVREYRPRRAAPVEEEEDVRVYAPPLRKAQPARPMRMKDPDPDLPARRGTSRFRAVTERTREEPPRQKIRRVEPEPEPVTVAVTEEYSDVEDVRQDYAAYQSPEEVFDLPAREEVLAQDRQSEAFYSRLRDFNADFGLDFGDEDPEEQPRKPRKQRREMSGAAAAAAPVLDLLSSVRVGGGRHRESTAYEEADLGPEVSAARATRYYGSRINVYRSRLHIAAVLCVILSWLSLGLPVAGSLKNPAVCACMCLILQLTIMLLGLDIFVAGLRNLLRGRPDAQSLVSVSCLASIVDACVVIYTHGNGEYLPFCVVSGVSMCFAIYGAMLYCRGQRYNFRVLTLLRKPNSVSVEQGLSENSPTALRTGGAPEEYIHYSEEEDAGETVYGIVAPLLLAAAPVLSLAAVVLTKNYTLFFHVLAALAGAAASFSALIAFPLPFCMVQQELFRSGTAVGGWSGIRDIGTAGSVVITDKDLFPSETISIESVRILEGVDPQTAISYVSSLISASGSCLAPVFTELVRKNNCVLQSVGEFRCHEAGGLTAMIDGAEVLVGSSTFMKLMGIHLPQKLSSKNSVFLAINSRLVGIITVSYKPVVSVQRGLAALLQSRGETIFASRDFNITPLLVSQKFKMPTDRLSFPTYAERYRITDPQADWTGPKAAVVKRKTLQPFSDLVTKARKLYSSVCLSVGFSVLSSIAGMILMFFLCATSAFGSATPGNLLFFMLLWLVPTAVFSIGMTK